MDPHDCDRLCKTQNRRIRSSLLARLSRRNRRNHLFSKRIRDTIRTTILTNP